MSNSFSLDMDKYLDKRNFTHVKEKPSTFKNIMNQIPFFAEIQDLIKKFKEKEQMVEIQDTTSSVHVVEKKSFIKAFGEALSEVVLFKKKEELDVPIEEAPANTNSNQNNNITQAEIDRLVAKQLQQKAVFKDENFFNNPKHSFEMPKKNINKDMDKISIEEEPDNLVENTLDNLSRRDKIANQTFSEKEASQVLESEWDRNEKFNQELGQNCPPTHNKVVLYKAQMQEDVKYILNITHRLIKLAPRPALEEFKQTPDFQKYVALLEKYEIAKRQN
jgi:hypothetical protein